MSVQLPSELVWVLDLLGFSWPAADEDRLREAAAAWRNFARSADDVRTSASGIVTKVAQDNYGEVIDAVGDYWREFDGNGGHLPDAAEAARLVAEVLDGFAVAVEVAKGAVIVQLGICAAAIIAAQAAAPFTLGLSEVGALAASQTARLAIRRIVKEQIENVVQHQLARKLRGRIKEIFQDLLEGMRKNLDDVVEGFGGQRLAMAGGPGRIPRANANTRRSGSSGGSGKDPQTGSGQNEGPRRSEHAEQRREQGRRVGPAFNDAGNARQADVFTQSDGRYVVRGPRGREHIFEPDGAHITTVDRSKAAHQANVRKGRRQPVTEEGFSKFKELFG